MEEAVGEGERSRDRGKLRGALSIRLIMKTGRPVAFGVSGSGVGMESASRETRGGFRLRLSLCWNLGLRSLVLGCALGLSGCGAPAPPVYGDGEIAGLTPVASVLAPELQERCRLTPNATNGELAGQILEVRGVVSMVGGMEGVGSYVMLVGGNKGANPVVCWMQEPELWSSVAPGMSVTVKGQFERLKERASYLDRPAIPIVRKGVLVSAEMPRKPLVDLSAKEFCAGVQDDRDLVARADDNWLWLTGDLLSVDPIQSIAYLDGGDSWVVVCRLAEGVKARLEAGEFPVGSRVRVLGSFEQLGPRRVQLSGCLFASARDTGDLGGAVKAGVEKAGGEERSSDPRAAHPAVNGEAAIEPESTLPADETTPAKPAAAAAPR